MRIIVTGATGLIGSEVVRAAIADKNIDELILLVRNRSELRHSKITSVIHKDFCNYTAAKEYFERADALIWCLGISQTQVSKKQYEVITYDYTKACIDFCKQVKPSIRFVFVSGDGADRTEQSRTLFKRLKGKAENALLQSGLSDVIIARPDAVRPRRKNKRAPFAYKLVYPLFPLVEKLAPHKVIWSDVLAKALLELAKEGHDEDNTVGNIELRVLGKL
jgi:uncharacterized protein YbjT (DUF2867 family)